jgi:hypothetical protein
MYLCRHLLLRRNIPKRVPNPHRCRRLFSNKSNSQSGVQDDNVVRVNVEFSIDDPSSGSKAPDKTLSKASQEILQKPLPLHLLLPKRARLPSQEGYGLGESDAAGEPKSHVVGTYEHIDAYETLRSRDATLVNDLPAATWIRVAKDAFEARLPDVMDHLAADLVENFWGSEEDRSQIASAIVEFAAARPLLSHARLHSLLVLLKSSGSLADLKGLTVVRLTKTMVAQLSEDSDSGSSLSILLSLLDRSLRWPSVRATGTGAISYHPPAVVQLSYHLIQTLLRAHRDHEAIDIFQVLVKCNNIPPEAVRETNSASTDPSFIILSTLVRSSLHWGWRGSAVELCKILLLAKMSPSAPVIELTVDVLYALLETPNSADLDRFSYLIRKLDARAVDFRPPHGLIRLFYESAYKLNAGKSAETLYEHTQSTDVASQHKYPSPQGRALTWLLSQLAVTSRNIYLSRRLANHVVDSCEPIPLQDRARFIAIVASSGYGLLARALWERYTVGRDRNVVLGNATVMLRMVSLYSYTIRKTQSLLDGVAKKEENDGVDEVVKSERSLYEDRMKDITTFMHMLVAEYRRIKKPLSTAGHYDLTSLARAYFMLGDVSAGFDAFKALLNRKEIPDMHDINVALSAMAEYNPRRAARIIHLMIRRGLQPDPVTFGTVIHYASIHKDAELVSALVHKAYQADNGELTLKSVQALIKATIEMEDPSLGTSLEQALEIIQSLIDSNLFCSPNTGKYCVAASLDVQKPVLAFKFWKLLVHNKIEWHDSQHSLLRQRIAGQALKHNRLGWLDADLEKVILHTLGKAS